MTDHAIQLATPQPAGEVFATLRRYDRFPRYAGDILSVAVDGGTSRWVAGFRGGLVRWTQRDVPDPDRLRVDFEQVDGDFVDLSGGYAVEPHGSGCLVVYRVSVRTSVPHLAGAIDPMVARVLLRAVLGVVSAACGPAEVLAGADALQDPPLPGR
ncbi:MAG TPA: SRPBCC family protein [Actinophytocola sp.]|uniref:type II toxin-antitoxin system RatA family toxin n=1 Tax=Actinophytocola sp. TaxID=1872138 RepID=UPI002DDC940A|nr:SRPBCC family protein [Actinophytocola sp.]HEV2783358.1 SRPBCC family protein [Actinophytocola sp.]